ncbi:MAG TPA: hypothetical protein VI432_02010 [Candidatus Paceibacterota bacterium]
MSPSIPGLGWKIANHQGFGKIEIRLGPDGELYIDGKKVVMHLSVNQQGRNVIAGLKLFEELKGQPNLNAIIMDFLIENPHFIPKSFEAFNYIFFWGTTFSVYKRLCIRCIVFKKNKWEKDFTWIQDNFGNKAPAAIIGNQTL